MADDTQLSLDAQIWKACPRCGRRYLRVEGMNSRCDPCRAELGRLARLADPVSRANVQARTEAAELRRNGRKRCADCGEVKPHSQFNRHSASSDKIYPYCKPCTSERNKANRARRGAAGVMADRARMYGLTVDELEALIGKGRCDCCGSVDPGSPRGWQIDHDHRCCPGTRACGKCIRGVLCVRCNVALGVSDESPARLRALLRYLGETA